jgi:hypothetical protein
MNSEMFGLLLTALHYFMGKRLGGSTGGFQFPGMAVAQPGQAAPQQAAQTQAPQPQPTQSQAQPQAQGQRDPNQIASMLDQLASESGEQLNWRNSVNDLMKTLGLDASIAYRKKLAAELGRNAYGGSADDNRWLHSQVMQQLAQHGVDLQQQVQQGQGAQQNAQSQQTQTQGRPNQPPQSRGR